VLFLFLLESFFYSTPIGGGEIAAGKINAGSLGMKE
jgi:hypothetical protein